MVVFDKGLMANNAKIAASEKLLIQKRLVDGRYVDIVCAHKDERIAADPAFGKYSEATNTIITQRVMSLPILDQRNALRMTIQAESRPHQHGNAEDASVDASTTRKKKVSYQGFP